MLGHVSGYADASDLALVTEQTGAGGSNVRCVRSVRFTPDGTRIVSGGRDGDIGIGIWSGDVGIWSWMAGVVPQQLALTNTIIERAAAHGSEAVCQRLLRATYRSGRLEVFTHALPRCAVRRCHL